MIEPIVNVVIPTLGDGPYLREAIESVLAQTYAMWNLVISPSSPETRVERTVEPYLTDSRVRLLEPAAEMNAAENFNFAIQSGSAPYVALLHDDDRWYPDFLGQSAQFMDSHANCGFVFSAAVKIDADGRRLGREKLRLHQGPYATSAILPRLYRKNFIAAPAVLARRTAYEAIGEGFRDLLFLDHDMWLRLAARFDVGYVAGWQTEYRIHSLQVSSRRRLDFGRARLELLDAVDDLAVSPSLRRLARAEAHVSCALDQAELGSRTRTWQHVRAAVRSDPTTLVRPRLAGRSLVATSAAVLGGGVQRQLTMRRSRRWQTGGVES